MNARLIFCAFPSSFAAAFIDEPLQLARRVSVFRTRCLATLVIAFAAWLCSPRFAAGAMGGIHGVQIGKACESPRCVGNTTDCTIQVGYADDFGDTIEILECWDVVDPDKLAIRVPSEGNLPIVSVSGNTTCSVGGSLPCKIGPGGSTLSGLPGLAGDGVIQFQTNTYVIQAEDPSPLFDQANIKVQDLCDDPGTTGCSTIANNMQFTAQTEIGECCHSPANVGFALSSERTLLFFTAADFVPSGSQINEVTWWGFYLNQDSGPVDCGPGLGDDFQLKIYDNDGGLPGTLLATRSLSPDKTLDGVRFSAYDEYKYVASLGSPIAVTNGQCYWLEITNNSQTTECYWFWSPSGEGNSHVVQDADFDGVYEPWDSIYDSDLAFCLDAVIDPNDCGDVIGQCCPASPGSCSEVTQANCPSGRWRLDATCTPNPCATPPNNACGAATPITDGVTGYDNWFATTDGPGPGATVCDSASTTIVSDIWYAYTATCTGNLTASLCDRTPHADPVLAVYGNETATCTCPPTGPLIQCSDDECVLNPLLGASRRPSVTVAVQEGNCYLLRLGSNGDFIDQGHGQIEIECRAVPLFVHASATGQNDGTSWADAYVHLQSALADAAGNPNIEEIWVGDGTYMPDGGRTPTGGTHVNGSGDRAATFQLLNGVAIYGGFAGDETDLSQRDIDANPTILSGDSLGNDGPNFANNAENSYHILDASGVDATGVLDGFTITSGNADGTFPQNAGAGLYALSGSPTLQRCQFRLNRAVAGGGGIYNWGGSPIISRSVFVGNAGGNLGGALHNRDVAQPMVVSCEFIGNTADYGAGVFNDENSAATLSNSVLSGNSCNIHGAGIYNENGSDAVIRSCTLTGNTAAMDGGAIYNANSSPVILNTVLWGNQDNGGVDESAQIHTATGTPVVHYSIVQGGWSGAGLNNLNVDPLFVDSDGPDGVLGTLDDNLRLRSGSPAIDAGDTTALPLDILDLDGDGDTAEYIPFDLARNLRQFDDPSTTDTGVPGSLVVDIGAYEYFTDCNSNGVEDSCDLACGAPNGPCDIPGCGTSFDCHSLNWPSNGVADECDINSCQDGDPDCDDCNLNGRPDGCDIGAGFSLDVAPMDGRPDECVNFTGLCNPPTDEWSCFNNWDIPGDVYPDNDMSTNYSVVLDGTPDNVCLDVNVVIDTLDIANGAKLRITQPDPACGGTFAREATLTLPSPLARERDNGLILPSPLGRERENRGSPTTLDIVAEGGMSIEGTTTETSTVMVASDNQINVTNGATVVGTEGVYQVDPAAGDDSSAELNTAELIIKTSYCANLAGCPDGGAVCLSDDMTVSVAGDLTIDGRLAVDATCGMSASACGDGASARRLGGYTPPILTSRERASISVGGSVFMHGSAELVFEPAVAGSKPLSLGGDFVNEVTNPACFNASTGGFILNGSGTQVFEAASTDVGEAGGRGDAGGRGGSGANFAIGAIEVTAGTPENPHVVIFRDSYDNNALGQASCDEAVYVGTLTLGANVQVILDNCRLYAGTLVQGPSSTITERGCGALVGVPVDPPPVMPDPNGVTKNRFVGFVVSPPAGNREYRIANAEFDGNRNYESQATGDRVNSQFATRHSPFAIRAGEQTALRVTLSTLNHPRFCCTSSAGASCSSTTCNVDSHCASVGGNPVCAHQANAGPPFVCCSDTSATSCLTATNSPVCTSDANCAGHPGFPECEPAFKAFEGKIRYVNSFPGLATPHLCPGKGAPFNHTYRCATLGCEPEYRDWATELQAATNPASPGGLVFITESAMVPSSTVNVQQIAASCGGSATANTCTEASAALAVGTAKWGDISAAGFGPPDGVSNVLDIPPITNFLKDVLPLFGEERTWLKQRDPAPNLDAITVIELSDAVDAGPQARPYPINRTIDACPHD